MAVLTVTELNRYLKRMMECDPLLGRITVKGELSNCKLHYSGHLYFALKDEGAVVRGVMFRSAASSLSFRPESGQKVIISGRISVYERDGQYQLYADSMQPDGIGALYLAYEQLKARLEQEGLFDVQRKKPIPAYPRRIGVITSPTGAAIRDILNILSRRYRLADVYLYPVLVQGAEAPGELVEALHYFHTTGWADVLIIGRGGGSIEDLWAFNDERVARAIAGCRIPVISAVGHETDYTIADFAADLRAPTPSAAAELAVPSQIELGEKTAGYFVRLQQAYFSGLEKKRARLKGIIDRRVFAKPEEQMDRRRLDLDHLLQRFVRAAEQGERLRRERVSHMAARLQALSPLAVLERGYAAVSDREGWGVSKISQLETGQTLSLQFADGTAWCNVLKIEERRRVE
ncbi:MAG: exodeoxyribonuclease VII large subunit [Clostridia bacterium]|nr:exodeoxyribonuclease VII large subunit [Clostridia bacterium]